MPNLRYDLKNRNRDLRIFLPDFFLPDYLISPKFSIRFSHTHLTGFSGTPKTPEASRLLGVGRSRES